MIFESRVHQFQRGFLFAFHIPPVIIGQINALALLQKQIHLQVQIKMKVTPLVKITNGTLDYQKNKEIKTKR